MNGNIIHNKYIEWFSHIFLQMWKYLLNPVVRCQVTKLVVLPGKVV